MKMKPTPFVMSSHHPDCACAYAWRSLGRVYDQDIGEAWVRMNTEPDCEYHGEEGTVSRS